MMRNNLTSSSHYPIISLSKHVPQIGADGKQCLPPCAFYDIDADDVPKQSDAEAGAASRFADEISQHDVDFRKDNMFGCSRTVGEAADAEPWIRNGLRNFKACGCEIGRVDELAKSVTRNRASSTDEELVLSG